MEFNISYAMDLQPDQIIGFEGDALTRRIIDWFEELYGDRLKVSFREGKSIALLNGDPFRVHIPIVLGNVRLICDANRLNESGDVDPDGQTVVNVLDEYDDLTERTARHLKKSERYRLINEYRAATSNFHRLNKLSEFQDTLDIRSDLDAAAEQIMAGEHGYGLSRWHSLQASEKALKSVLSCQMLQYPRTHDLFELAYASGMIGISPIALELSNCPPNVRYDDSTSTISDAINAFFAALETCAEVAGWVSEVGQPKENKFPKWAQST